MKEPIKIFQLTTFNSTRLVTTEYCQNVDDKIIILTSDS